jgi:hypothetical protein
VQAILQINPACLYVDSDFYHFHYPKLFEWFFNNEIYEIITESVMANFVLTF